MVKVMSLLVNARSGLGHFGTIPCASYYMLIFVHYIPEHLGSNAENFASNLDEKL